MHRHSWDQHPIYYGKGAVTVYRSPFRPLRVAPIPESGYTGSDGTMLAADVTVRVRGRAFWPAYAEGDNTPVVATDSMKNLIQRHAARYDGATLEGFLAFTGRRFLETYSHFEGVHMEAHELPFAAEEVAEGDTFRPSSVVFRRRHDARAGATVELARGPQGEPSVRQVSGGLLNLQLIKLKGNSFTGFVRDEYTTLPDADDRALFVYLDLSWLYTDPLDALEPERGRYVAAAQVAGLVATVFHGLETRSIQQLLYHVAMRMLERYPQLDHVRLEGQNHTWDEVATGAEDSDVKVYTDPRAPYGILGLVLGRDGQPRWTTG